MCGCLGGVRGCTRGHVWFYWGASVVLFGGHAWFYSGGAWFYLGGMHGFIRGGMRGFIRGVCVVLFRGGVCGFFSFFGYNEIRSMSGRYASYWNAFLFSKSFRKKKKHNIVACLVPKPAAVTNQCAINPSPQFWRENLCSIWWFK